MISAQRWSHPHNGGMVPQQQQTFQQQFNYPQQQQQQQTAQQMTGQPLFMPSASQSQFGQPMIGSQMTPQMTGQPRFIPSTPQLPPAMSQQQRMGNQSQTFSMGRPPMNGQGFQPRPQQQPFRTPSSGQFLIQPQQPSMMQQPSFDNRMAATNNNITNMQSPIQSPFNNNPMLSPQFNNSSQTQPPSSFRPSSMTMQPPRQQPMQSQLMQQQQQQQMQSQLMQQQQQQQLQQQQIQQLLQQRGQIPPPAMMPPASGTDMPVFTRPRAYSNTTDYTTTTGANSSPVKKSFSRYRATKLASVSVTFFDATYPPEATIGVSLDEAKLAYTVNDSVNIRNIPVCAIAVNSQNDSIQAGVVCDHAIVHAPPLDPSRTPTHTTSNDTYVLLLSTGDVIVTVNGIPTINVKSDLTGEFERPRMLTLKMLTDLQKSVRTIRFVLRFLLTHPRTSY